MRQDTQATRAQIVAVAERLFAERGVEAVSFREINEAAEQRNRSATQYHFGDKSGLIEAIFAKHTPSIEANRGQLLDAVEADGQACDTWRLTECLVLPVAAKLDDPDGGRAFVQLSARLIGDPDMPLVPRGLMKPGPGTGRLLRLMAAAVDMPPGVQGPRMTIATGMLFHGLSDFSASAPARRRSQAQELFVSALVDAITAVVGSEPSPATRRRLIQQRRVRPGRR